MEFPQDVLTALNKQTKEKSKIEAKEKAAKLSKPRKGYKKKQ